MANRKKATIEGEVFEVDDSVKVGELIPAEVSSVIDQKTGKEYQRSEIAQMPAAGTDMRLNFVKLEKG
ncbi:hypothetical protein [Ketobacter sp.]|uniref:hypothetical protein n=1 Tax=Ketobacter sp. TaxID=2083498 RepID=UPI000F163346|nr:hypothetical protein [Ketobacter sp.]RLU01752.1 MAG: hypothetical protein D9N14_01040 [Ketobacter sp.]